MPHELQIGTRRRTLANAPASIADFEVTPGAPVEIEWLVHNPRVSLYCLDAVSSQAIFVEVAPEVDLAAAPFVYHAQFEGAQRLFAMPYSAFLALADCLETELKRLILLFNSGRCGSTLLHHIFNQVTGVVSLSEPDGLIPYWDQETRLPLAETTALMQASAKILFRPQAFPRRAVAAIKFRGRTTTLLEQYHAAFPDATLLYLYRDALGWVASVARMMKRLGEDMHTEKYPLEQAIATVNSFHTQPLDLAALGLSHISTPLSYTEILTLHWLLTMDCYLEAVEKGLPVSAWRFADLNHQRQETLARLFARCGLPRTAVETALATFERDSQAGTPMAGTEGRQGKRVGLTAEQEHEVRALVCCHPIIQEPDFVAPSAAA